MRLVRVRKTKEQGRVRLGAQMEEENGVIHGAPFFEFPEAWADDIASAPDPFIPPLLIAAMRAGVPLRVDLPVSERLCKRIPEQQAILQSLHPRELKTVPFHAAAGFRPPHPAASGIGAFFSLGVDSFHTLLRHEPAHTGDAEAAPCTHLIYIVGFENPLDDFTDGRDEAVAAEVHAVAEHWRKSAVCVRTNLRHCLDVPWARQLHGPVLAAIGLALSGRCGTVRVPASYTWRALQPWGSHPVLDPLWSTDEVEIVHDGAEVDRARKIADTVVRSPFARSRLRVCTKQGGGAGNCGACGKCLRTMTTLEITGALGDSPCFPVRRLPRSFWRHLRLKSRGDVDFSEENRRLAEAYEAPPWIRKGLRRAILMGEYEIIRKQHGNRGFIAGLMHFVGSKTFSRWFFKRG